MSGWGEWEKLFKFNTLFLYLLLQHIASILPSPKKVIKTIINVVVSHLYILKSKVIFSLYGYASAMPESAFYRLTNHAIMQFAVSSVTVRVEKCISNLFFAILLPKKRVMHVATKLRDRS